MKATGNKPPGSLPAKARYMQTDLLRAAKHFNVPIRYPKDLSVMMTTLKAQRMLTAARLEHPDLVEGITRELWLRIWSRDVEIVSENGLKEACIAAGSGRTTAESLVALAETDVVSTFVRFWSPRACREAKTYNFSSVPAGERGAEERDRGSHIIRDLRGPFYLRNFARGSPALFRLRSF